ncbi:hypothetical protein B0T10DRAFT_468030 [Thelonectria olida]|uniref:Uncharacterized protein n=1 Tax=Thelonectria olida TaxID=1576542 RepID=A0A9P9ADP6_9HYPO|nr:hypothetical protein B0T10DRAFT_468030 [Thelonectria olida]
MEQPEVLVQSIVRHLPSKNQEKRRPTVVFAAKEESVWVEPHYAPMAAMPLFVNILLHPLGNPADNDLQILASASNMTRKIPMERLSGAEIEQIQEIGEFVIELVRLCHSAA